MASEKIPARFSPIFVESSAAAVESWIPAEFEEGTELSPRLLDVNLIIVGDGPEAERLLERRWEEGGRVCLLWTSRLPERSKGNIASPEEFEDEIENLEDESAELEHVEGPTSKREDTKAEPADLSEELIDEAQDLKKPPHPEKASEQFEAPSPKKEPRKEQKWPMFQLKSFTWQPPSRSAPSAAVVVLRKRFACMEVGSIRIGPDIVDLKPGQWYELIFDRHGRPTGVCVLQRASLEHGEVEVAWQLSGAVLLADGAAGQAGEQKPEAWTETADVQVHCEDAKPAFVCHHGPVLFATLWFVACMLLWSPLHARFEPELRPGQFAWWRLSSGTVMSILPLAYHPVMTKFFLGFEPRRGRVSVRAASVVVYFLGWIPPMYVLGGKYHVPYFAMAMVLMETWTLVEFSLMHRLHGETRTVEPETPTSLKTSTTKPKDFKKQLLYTFGLASSRTLYQGSMWIITLVYGILEPVDRYLAGFWLTTATALSELAYVGSMQFLYNRFVWRPRVDPLAKTAVVGDQIEGPCGLLCFAHGITESVRLTNLLAAAVWSTGWQWSWLGTIAMIFVANVAQRYGLHTYIITLILPKRFWGWIRPGCTAMVHRHARFYCGYHRFLGVISLVAVNTVSQMVIPGRTSALLYNEQTLILALVLLGFEILEDVVVYLNLLPLDPWRSRMMEFYEKLHPLHIKQLMCKDNRGISNAVPLRLHCARWLSPRVSRLLIDTKALMFMVFFWVPMGIGFTVGICSEPIPGELRALDAIVWTTPWRCS
ncbi:unnamed protein product [Symbiodinium sp. CCMP2592]|nr:unnamed protein product [Symbiodinium sp. CCMP2592]